MTYIAFLLVNVWSTPKMVNLCVRTYLDNLYNMRKMPQYLTDRQIFAHAHYYSGNKILVFYFLLSTYERKLSPIVIWIWGWHPRLLARVWYLVSGVHVRGSVYIQPCHRDDLCTTVIPRTKWKYHMVTIRSITSAQIYTIPVYASQSLRYSE